jgi:hypothetical protein
MGGDRPRTLNGVGDDLAAAVMPAARLDGDEGGRLKARRLWLYRITTLALSAIVLAAILDALGVYPFYGVDSRHAVAQGRGYELDVRYAEVSRPAVATPFDIEVRRDGGFDGPVTVAVSSDYLSIWDENGLDPSPSKETARPGMLIWEFEPPPGDALEISFDARIEPAAQRGKRGFVSVLGPDGAPLVAVSFRTRLRP